MSSAAVRLRASFPLAQPVRPVPMARRSTAAAVDRLERTGFGIALDLERGVADPEMIVHLARNAMPKNVAVALDRHHQMRGERGFGRAHLPDMQVVDRIATPHRRPKAPSTQK